MATLEELNKLKTDIDFHIHQAETASERENLENLLSEITADNKNARELDDKAKEIAIRNQSKIKSLLAEVEKLRFESIDLSVDALALKQRLGLKQTQAYQLEKAIKEKKIIE
jgi:hypothetical protein